MIRRLFQAKGSSAREGSWAGVLGDLRADAAGQAQHPSLWPRDQLSRPEEPATASPSTAPGAAPTAGPARPAGPRPLCSLWRSPPLRRPPCVAWPRPRSPSCYWQPVRPRPGIPPPVTAHAHDLPSCILVCGLMAGPSPPARPGAPCGPWRRGPPRHTRSRGRPGSTRDQLPALRRRPAPRWPRPPPGSAGILGGPTPRPAPAQDPVVGGLQGAQGGAASRPRPAGTRPRAPHKAVHLVWRAGPSRLWGVPRTGRAQQSGAG